MINFLCLKLTLSAAAMVKESNPARMEVGYNPPPTKKDCRFNQKKKKRVRINGHCVSY